MEENIMNECPAYNNGRWYRLIIESKGSEYNITTVDKGINSSEMSGNHLMLPQDFIAVDYKFINDNSHISAASGTKLEIYKYASGRHGVTLPAASDFTSLDVYVFGYYKR